MISPQLLNFLLDHCSLAALPSDGGFQYIFSVETVGVYDLKVVGSQTEYSRISNNL